MGGRDTIERNQRQSELQESEERFRSLVELAPDGIITVNMKGTITSINTAYTTLTGWPSDEIVGKHFTQIGVIRLRDLPKFVKMFGSWLRGKDPPPFEFEYVRKNGSRAWGEAHFKLVEIGRKKKELIGILRDITDRVQREADMRKLMEELERSNNELDDYTYAVSHDLKAPLRTIESFSSFLLEDYSDNLDDTGRDYLIRMKDATFRMKNLIDDLLLLSRVGRKYTEAEYIDLNILLKDIISDFEITLKEIKGKILLGKLPVINTQKVWMRQLFANLISNGLKFNKSKEPRVWISCEEREDEYFFSVKDNGIGIDKKHQAKIFNIFQRLHTQEEYPGTGAGLTICRKIINSFGGKIWLDSKPRKGSTFYFTIPKEQVEEIEYQPQTDLQVTQIQNGMQIQTE